MHSYSPINEQYTQDNQIQTDEESDLKDVSFNVEVHPFFLFVNIISSMIGLSVLIFPYQYSKTGTYVSTLSLTFVLYLILRGVKFFDYLGTQFKVNGPNMSSLIEKMMGVKAMIITEFIIAIDQSSIIIARIILLSKLKRRFFKKTIL